MTFSKFCSRVVGKYFPSLYLRAYYFSSLSVYSSIFPLSLLYSCRQCNLFFLFCCFVCLFYSNANVPPAVFPFSTHPHSCERCTQSSSIFFPHFIGKKKSGKQKRNDQSYLSVLCERVEELVLWIKEPDKNKNPDLPFAQPHTVVPYKTASIFRRYSKTYCSILAAQKENTY